MEKNIIEFFRGVLKGRQGNLEPKAEDTATNAVRKIPDQADGRLERMRYEVKSLCEEKKEEVGEFASELIDMILKADLNQRRVPARRKRS